MSTRRLGVGLLVIFAATLAGCGTEPSEEVETPLECGGEPCDLPLEEGDAIRITLTSTSCDAVNNAIRITAPASVAQVLTANACYETPGRECEFAGPFPNPSAIDFTIDSRIIDGDPALRATGTYPTWTISFEDGADEDFNDIVLTVEAIAAAQ